MKKAFLTLSCHWVALWCIVTFLFLLFDDLHFNFHDAKVMYANGRLIHAGRGTAEESNIIERGFLWWTQTHTHKEQKKDEGGKNSWACFEKAQTCSQVFPMSPRWLRDKEPIKKLLSLEISHRSWARRWGSWQSCWGGGSHLLPHSRSLSFRARMSLGKWCLMTGRLSPCRCLWERRWSIINYIEYNNHHQSRISDHSHIFLL